MSKWVYSMSVRVKTLLIKSVFVYLSIVLFVYLCKQSLLCKGLDEKKSLVSWRMPKGVRLCSAATNPIKHAPIAVDKNLI